MIWRLGFSKKADKQLSKMDKSASRIIVAWLMKNIDGCEDPRVYGRGLTATRSGEWRYRIGDYRVLCDIQDAKLVVLAFNIEHGSKVYD
jgi:mRNA interferase RelE/StbE